MRDISAGVMAVECGSSPARNLPRPETAAYMPDRTILRVPQVFLGALFCVNTTKTQVVTRMDSFRHGSFIRIGPIGRWQCALAWTASIFSLQDGG